jgi:multiple sugar transport system permease protein
MVDHTKVLTSSVQAGNYRRRQKIKGTARQVLSHLLLVPLAVIFMLPYFWMISTSLKPDEQVFAWPLIWIPSPLVWANYPDAIQFFPFWQYLGNTLQIAGFNIVGAVLSCTMVAYSIACIPWRGRNILFMGTLATMMLPFQVTMVPLFIVFSKLGWVNSYRPLIVPSFFGSAFFIFLLRQFFKSIPKDLFDAAKIDGASYLRIYWQVVLPLAKPAMFTVALFQFLNSWRDFLGPLIYLSDNSQYTISLGLQYFKLEHDTEWQLLMAASIMLTAPVVVLFFFTQRTFVQGISMTGIKG